MALKPKFIGVSGGSGSGKTTLVSRLQAGMDAASVLVIQMDNYYLDLSGLTQAERDRRNFDHPDAFDTPLLIQHIKELASERSVARPSYDFASHTRSAKTVELKPAAVIVLDGILTLHDPALRELYDLSIFVDVDDDVRLLRRMRRDIGERGRTMESVINQYLASVKAMHDRYVAPQKLVADIIVSWMDYNDRAVAMLAGMVDSWLKNPALK